MSTMDKPGPCGDPDCDDGDVFNPPLQEGARGCITPCPRCAENWRRYWAARDSTKDRSHDH